MTLRIGPFELPTPVVLAPMAGVTNAPFRTLCREHGAGLYVSEMITSRAVVERNEKTLQMIRFSPEEDPRSLQLYGVDAAIVGEAVAYLVGENLADHIDLNFGCPVPKVTRRGGGAALPYKRGLLRDILRAAVRAAGATPVTMKMRVGIDPEHHTFLDAARIGVDEGVAAVALHARTAQQHYSGQADWSRIGELAEQLRGSGVPVLGNGDIFSAADAVAMMSATGCDGVVVGRGCLGRPWLFRDLADAFAGRELRPGPSLGEVGTTIRRHGELLIDWLGDYRGIRELRKHISWYLTGFPARSELRHSLGKVESLAQLDELLGQLDATAPWPGRVADSPRGRQGSPRPVSLPEHWLDDPDACVAPGSEAELATSGG